MHFDFLNFNLFIWLRSFLFFFIYISFFAIFEINSMCFLQLLAAQKNKIARKTSPSIFIYVLTHQFLLTPHAPKRTSIEKRHIWVVLSWQE